MKGKMTTVQFRHWECVPVIGAYGNKRPALALIDAITGEIIATASINMPEVPLDEGEIIIKDYSENVGMLAALLAVGIIEETERAVQMPYGDPAPICRLRADKA